MSFENAPSAEIHKGDQLLDLFGLAEFAYEPIDVGDGQGAIHHARDYPYVGHPNARTMIESILSLPDDDPRKPIIVQAGRREMAKRLNLLPSSVKEGEWVKADGTAPANAS